MLKISFLLGTALFLLSCNASPENKKKNAEALREKALYEMVQTDNAFSDACKQGGMKKAFIEYLADEAVLLRPGYLPIVDDEVIKFISAQEDTSFKMYWEPKGAEVAASSDMGYTYGIYQVETRDTLLKGTYLSVWKKLKGQWKLVVDTGNPGAEKTAKFQ
jgi:hypothetical protein